MSKAAATLSHMLPPLMQHMAASAYACACCLHLNTQYVLLPKQIPLTTVLDNLVTGADETIVYDRILSISVIAINKPGDVATLTGESLHRSMVVRCLKQTILLEPWVFGFIGRKLLVVQLLSAKQHRLHMSITIPLKRKSGGTPPPMPTSRPNRMPGKSSSISFAVVAAEVVP
ncbi:hypothetical protein KCU94_g31, partial [Aureobasidium melanogenum]